MDKQRLYVVFSLFNNSVDILQKLGEFPVVILSWLSVELWDPYALVAVSIETTWDGELNLLCDQYTVDKSKPDVRCQKTKHLCVSYLHAMMPAIQFSLYEIWTGPDWMLIPLPFLDPNCVSQIFLHAHIGRWQSDIILQFVVVQLQALRKMRWGT